MLRNTISGHLDEDMIQATLDGMDPLTEGLIPVGETRGEMHYNFGAELLWAALSRDTSE